MTTRKKKNNIGAFGHPIYGKGFAKYGEMRTNGSSEIPNDHPLPEDTVLFNKGVEEGKRLMMEDAEEYKVGMHGEPINITLDKYVQRARGIFPGDKVRIIIVKEGAE